MSLPGSGGGNAGVRRLGTDLASHSFTPTSGTANGTRRTFAFDENRNRQLSIHNVLVPQRSVVRECVCQGKIPMEIRVEVHEEIKKDYDSMHTTSVLQTAENVSVALCQTIASHLLSRFLLQQDTESRSEYSG